MAYKPAETFQGVVDFTNIDTSANRVVTVGLIVRGVDTASSKSGGEFIYLPGVASNTVGSLVTYNPLSISTTTLAASTVDQGVPLAVSMSANITTSSYSWYQITGVATIKKSAVKVSPNSKMFIGTTGRVTAAIASGKTVLPSISVNAATVASATSTVQVFINRSFAQSR
jgi:hypothetical protein